MAKDYIGCFYLDRNDIVPASDITEVEVSKGRFVNVGKTFVSLVILICWLTEEPTIAKRFVEM